MQNLQEGGKTLNWMQLGVALVFAMALACFFGWAETGQNSWLWLGLGLMALGHILEWILER